MNDKYVARLLAMIGARWSRYSFFFCLTPSQLAANSQSSNLSPILTRHRSTAELRVVGIEASCTQLTPESNDLAMSRLYIRQNNCQLLRWPTDQLPLHSTCVLATRERMCDPTEEWAFDRKKGLL